MRCPCMCHVCIQVCVQEFLKAAESRALWARLVPLTTVLLRNWDWSVSPQHAWDERSKERMTGPESSDSKDLGKQNVLRPCGSSGLWSSSGEGGGYSPVREMS